MDAHTLGGDRRQRARIADAAQGTEPAVGEPRGVAAHGVSLDDGALYTRLAQEIRGGDSDYASADDYDVRVAVGHTAPSSR